MRRHKYVVATMIMALLYVTAPRSPCAAAAEKNLFNQLVERSQGEMAKAKGKLSVLLDLPAKEIVPILKVFQKGSSGFRVANVVNAISVQGLGHCTAEAWFENLTTLREIEGLRARSEEFLIKKYSELCELCGHEKKFKNEQN